MPAHTAEVDDAEREGVPFSFLVAPAEVVGDAAAAPSAACAATRMALGAPDASGRRRPEPIPGSEFVHRAATIVIAAIGMAPGHRRRSRADVAVERDGHARRRPRRSCQSGPAVLFAAGDVVTGADRHHAGRRRGPAGRAT